MRKIPTVFRRDPNDMSRVLSEVNSGCEWVLNGEGVATRKYDGTCVMLDDGGQWWARREVKSGKTPPENYIPVATDEITGKTMGWEPIRQSPFNKAHLDALQVNHGHEWTPGTYELIGPKINDNPERLERHDLRMHRLAETYGTTGVPRRFEDLKRLVLALNQYGSGWEGVVFHHPDGRMAKLKARDFPEGN